MAALNLLARLLGDLAGVAAQLRLALRLQTGTVLMAALELHLLFLVRLLHTLVVAVVGLMVGVLEQLAAQAVRVVAVMEPQQEPQQQEL